MVTSVAWGPGGVCLEEGWGANRFWVSRCRSNRDKLDLVLYRRHSQQFYQGPFERVTPYYPPSRLEDRSQHNEQYRLSRACY